MGLAVGVNKCKIMLNSRKDGARRIDKVSRYHEGQCVARTCGSLHAESTIVKMPVATFTCSRIQPDSIIEPLDPQSAVPHQHAQYSFSYRGNWPSSPFPLPQVVRDDLTFPQSRQCDTRRSDRVRLTSLEHQDHM